MLPACSLAVTQGGKIVHSKAYGLADLEHGIKNTPDTVFFAASLSKQFTAMSILLLSQQTRNGQPAVDLDADVRHYLDELKHLPKKITVRQLLHHTSGIRDMLIQLTLAGWRWGDDVIKRAGRPGPRIPDGDPELRPRPALCLQQYQLLPCQRDRCAPGSGKSLAEFARENIFVPLEMTSTRFVDSYCETVENRACGYRSLDGSRTHFEKRTPNYNLTGPTNLFTTAKDLLRWDKNFDSNVVGGARRRSEAAGAERQLQRLWTGAVRSEGCNQRHEGCNQRHDEIVLA